MKEIEAFIRPHRLESILEPLYAHPEFPGVIVTEVRAFGHVVGPAVKGEESSLGEVAMMKLECVVRDDMLDQIVHMILEGAQTGHPGDGKIVIRHVEDTIRISTEEHGEAAL
jgi:nitrogen regulatory protein P-II 1